MSNANTYHSLQILLLVVFSMVGLANTAEAATVEQLLMPGKLIEGHKKFESDCNHCHINFKKKGQTKLCLDCHKKIRADINVRKGYHGRHKTIARQHCYSCHTEHQGRNADIVKLDTGSFNHRLTDFPLHGAHQNARCQDCHKPNHKYREAPHSCNSCHRKDSPHQTSRLGKLNERCDSCHNDARWLDVSFDHRKTRFALTGAHRAATCAGCHPADQFFHTPTGCFSCHRLDDVHQGGNGRNCKKCHSTRSWKKLSFDHDQDTDFPLHGRHNQLSCQACHKQDPYKVKIKSTCISCHRNDDDHHGRYGTRCDSCHNAQRWKQTHFDHDRKTDFPLKGKHAQASCTACHKGNIFKEKLKTGCYACHRIDDAHNGQEGKQCERCHQENGWRQKVRFDHDLTRFPLIGLHAVVPCEECHLSSTYKAASIDCVDCHKQDDAHEQRLGLDCARCHNPNGWQIWRFDHNTQTQFKLDGGHKGLHCKRCHREPVARISGTPRTCISCHRGDDPHRGQFGPRCGRCHTTGSFRETKLQ